MARAPEKADSVFDFLYIGHQGQNVGESWVKAFEDTEARASGYLAVRLALHDPTDNILKHLVTSEITFERRRNKRPDVTESLHLLTFDFFSSSHFQTS